MEKIDFVLPWVDGSDKEWLALKRKYEETEGRAKSSDPNANGENRYRDYGLLQYWFRAVERFAPWVNRVFFVTCGQKPDWLNESNPKLRLVDHKDFIPAEYLPTFQARSIELNFHRIPDLSEHFVFFDDDMFLLRPVKPAFYFKKGLPVIPCDLGMPRWLGCSNTGRTVINNCGILNQNLDVERLIWKNIWKYTDIRALGVSRVAKNLASIVVNRTIIPGTFGHFPSAQLKSTFDEIWDKAYWIMDSTSRSRFRGDDTVNQWLLSAWNMVSGRFYPANEKKRGVYFGLTKDSLSGVCEVIQKQLAPQLCLNDKSIAASEMDYCIREISKAFDRLLPEKSSFEK